MLIGLLLLALVAAVAKLWHDLDRLTHRVRALERERDEWPEFAAPEPMLDPVPEHSPAALPERAVLPPPPADPAPPPPRELAEAEPAPGRVGRRRPIGLEELFGRRLPIWAGGLTLAVAGVLVVKLSIDSGLLSPAVRVWAGVVFGAALIGAAEAALRWHERVGDARVRQALAGAGLSTLYACVLVAANLYDLIPPALAFLALAAVTALAAGLSLRFGAPAAVLGLVGGLAAPAMVGSQSPGVPLLAAYLALAVGGLSVLGRGRGWPWLAIGALVGGFGWGAALIAGGALGTAAVLSLGGLLAILGIALPALVLGNASRLVRAGAAVAGGAQMAALVAVGGFAPLHWALFGLLSAALLWLARRQPELARVEPVAAGLALLLLLAWPDPGAGRLAAVLATAVALYGGSALARLWRPGGETAQAAEIAALAAAVPLVPLLHLHPGALPSAALALVGAGIAGGAAASGRGAEGRTRDARFATLVGATAALAVLAAVLALPAWLVAPAAALVAAAVLRLAPDLRVRRVAGGAAAVTLALLLAGPGAEAELRRAVGEGVAVPVASAVRWLVPALVAALFARTAGDAASRGVFAAASVPLLAVAAAPLLPVAALPLVPATVLACALVRPEWRPSPPALAAAGAFAGGWALEPLARWLVAGAAALMGDPMLAAELPTPSAALLRLAVPAACAWMAVARAGLPDRPLRIARVGLAAVALIAAHILFKRMWDLDPSDFAARGLAERTVWEALLAAGALAALRSGRTAVALGLGGAALAHFALFTAGWHDPLWSAQFASPVWVPLAYAVAAALLWQARRVPPFPTSAARAIDWGQMALAVLFAASALRMAFHGPTLAEGGVAPAEDIARSILAIALAVGFLLWGIARARIDWRIGSLALMLGAVGKVFLFDAAGLDGLARIASFAALGFSLIGVGWLYSRFLPAARGPETV